MTSKMLDELLEEWAREHDAMVEAAAPAWKAYLGAQQEIKEATAPFEAKEFEMAQWIAKLEEPFKKRLEQLFKDIEPRVIEIGPLTAGGVKAKLRKGYSHFGYDNNVMQAVMLTLQDSHPGTVKAIKRAVKETVVKPKVTLDRVKGTG